MRLQCHPIAHDALPRPTPLPPCCCPLCLAAALAPCTPKASFVRRRLRPLTPPAAVLLTQTHPVGGAAAASSKAGAVRQTPPPAEALPVPGTSTRPGRLFDAEPIDPTSVPQTLLMKPDPVFHGDRDERKREAADISEFALTVHFDALTSGLESETHFHVEEGQIIAGRCPSGWGRGVAGGGRESAADVRGTQ